MGSVNRVLHVDDDESLLDLTARYLEQHDDIVVTSESTPADGLEVLASEPIDCVVSDYDMPRTDGLAFFRQVREAGHEVPFILFTGHGSEAVASEAISVGVTDYLQKDVGAEQYDVLANRVRNYVDRYRTEREMERVSFSREVAGRLASDVIYEYDVDAEAFAFAEGFETTLDVVRPGENDAIQWWLSRVHPDDREQVFATLADTVRAEACEVAVEYRFRTDAGEYRHIAEDRYYEYDADGDVTRIIGAARDVTERRRRERRLDALHAASRDLMTTDSPEAVAEVASRAAAEILDLPINGVCRREGDVLVPVAYTDRAAEVIGEMPRIERGRALMWDVLEAGEVRAYADLTGVENVYNPATAIRSELFVPVEGYGVFVAASTTADDFDDVDVALAKVLVSNVEAALARLD